MLDKLYDLKAEMLQRLEKLVDERGLERLDAKELTDAIKDMSEAEYYCSVVEAMDSYGYMPDDMSGMGYDGGMGYGRGGNRQGGNRGGYGYRDSMGRYSTRANRRRGYRMGHMDAIDNIREELQSATQEEREQLKQELRQMLGM